MQGKRMARVAATATATAAVAALAVAALPTGASGAEEASYFAISLNGANEVQVPGGPAAGDRDGSAVAFLRVKGDEVAFAAKFDGIAAPTAGRIHEGAKGAGGDVRISLFSHRVRDGRTSVTGSVRVTDAALLADLRANPGKFYLNLATGEFPGGAVRGQVNKVNSTLDMDRALRRNVKAPVVEGVQIYACTAQADGTFAFTQDNVRARLEKNIAHFFVRPGPAGPPEWLAPDGSAVTGRVLTRTPNGAGNIAELDLAATQAGGPYGLLAGVDEILRLNTVGGVAPSGPCDPVAQPRVEVDYRADYVFLDSTRPLA